MKPAITVLSLLALLLILPAPAQAQDVCNPPPLSEDGEWVVRGVEICKDRTIHVRNLVVYNGGTLTLRNVELIIHAEKDANATYMQGIRVFSSPGGQNGDFGGTLYAYDSIFRPADPDKRAEMRLNTGSNTYLNGVTIEDFRSIFLIYPREFVMEDSTYIVHGRRGEGIHQPNGVIEGPYRFEGNFISNVNAGLMLGTNNTARNNTITDCGLGIGIRHNTHPTVVEHNTIMGCSAGIGEQEGFDCGSFTSHHNDVWDNVLNAFATDVGHCGDARWNWWGHRGGPEINQLTVDVRGHVIVEPWSDEANHPERLPQPLPVYPKRVNRGEAVSFNAASQPSTAFGFPIAKYAWDFGDGGAASSSEALHVYNEPGIYTVTLRTTDTMHLSNIDYGQITVINQHPMLSTTLTPARANPGDDLEVSHQASDPDGDAMAVNISWSRNGETQSSLDGETKVPGELVEASDTWSVRITAEDPYGGRAEQMRSVTISSPANPPTVGPPRVRELAILPQQPEPGVELRADVDLMSPNNESTWAAYEWTRNGVFVSSSSSVLGQQVVPGQWTLVVTPHNSHGVGQEASATVTVPSPPPVRVPPVPVDTAAPVEQQEDTPPSSKSASVADEVSEHEAPIGIPAVIGLLAAVVLQRQARRR